MGDYGCLTNSRTFGKGRVGAECLMKHCQKFWKQRGVQVDGAKLLFSNFKTSGRNFGSKLLRLELFTRDFPVQLSRFSLELGLLGLVVMGLMCRLCQAVEQFLRACLTRLYLCKFTVNSIEKAPFKKNTWFTNFKNLKWCPLSVLHSYTYFLKRLWKRGSLAFT